MRIGIDARFYNQSGIGRYLRNLIEELQKIDQDNEYYIFLLKADLAKVNLTPNFHPIEANFKWYGIEEQIKLPGLLKKYQLDLVHFPHFNVPIFYTGKFTVTIHDLTHQDFAMKRSSTRNWFVFYIKQLLYKRVFGHALLQSKKIITVSEFVAQELLKRWYVKDSKVVVTPEGVESSLLEIAEKMGKKTERQLLAKFGITPPYLFYVGNVHPHKNVENLIEAFLVIRQKYQYLSLVLSGQENYFWKRIKNRYKQRDIIYTGFLTDEELVATYKNAQVFVIPSLSEGFGIPVLEAMACGCPVVCSNKTSLPEVGGEAAIYFDPQSRADMIEKISQVLNDFKLRKTLIEKGQQQYQKFSWENLAKQTLEIYQEV